MDDRRVGGEWSSLLVLGGVIASFGCDDPVLIGELRETAATSGGAGTQRGGSGSGGISRSLVDGVGGQRVAQGGGDPNVTGTRSTAGSFGGPGSGGGTNGDSATGGTTSVAPAAGGTATDGRARGGAGTLGGTSAAGLSGASPSGGTTGGVAGTTANDTTRGGATNGTANTGGVSATSGGSGATSGGVVGGATANGGRASGGVSGSNASAGAASGGNASAGAAGNALAPPSCATLSAQCQSESCCTTIPLGASFPMGRSQSIGATDYFPAGSDHELPEHTATVGAFALDKYEVTVGRFRRFVEAYDDWRTLGLPKTGDGANTNVAGTGWGESWTSDGNELPSSSGLRSGLAAPNTPNCLWTDVAGDWESHPINCVTWFEAFAFCIWDGARLPTEAEWELAAAGGSENRLYPWGSEAPDASRANFEGDGTSSLHAVGHPLGAGAMGHRDLAGSVGEWVIDWYSASFYATVENGCVDCARVTLDGTSVERVLRGGGWNSPAGEIRAAYRTHFPPDGRDGDVGFRCARSR